MSLPCTVQYVHKHGGPGQARHQEGGGFGSAQTNDSMCPLVYMITSELNIENEKL